MANAGGSENSKICEQVNYWVFENGQWVQKSEPGVWGYCQEPEKARGFKGFAFKEMPHGLFKKPHPMTLHQVARNLMDLVGINELHGKFSTSVITRGKINIVFLRGKYSFEQLVKWKQLIEKTGCGDY
ncbi:hypothetical protein [Pyrococcus kukulkanii]|uniref:Uncharacterized protein n=1 Tax=Pyrococcus kukulkanii TaxID=1609559 RepID=A0A127BBT9_9EURY|nr:hypothetical protein [Pyrococcus kukulkanii]AMM54804.1 hypothetical protein TQ32_10115 [Pyrococcus kukulkanii]